MKKVFIYSLIAAMLLSGVQISRAAVDTYTLLEPLPCIATTGHPCGAAGSTITTFTVDQFIEYVFKFSMALAVFLAVVMVIWGGFEYMISESPFGKSSGKDKFKNAAIGLLGVFFSYLVLQTIDPRLVQINAQIAPICPKDWANGLNDAQKLASPCNPNPVTDFNKVLSDDLKKISTENRDAAIALDATINQLNQQKADLQNRYTQSQDHILDPSDPNYLTKDQYDAAISKLNLQSADVNAKQIQTITNGLGVAQFRLARDNIYNNVGNFSGYTADPVPNIMVNHKYPVDSPNTIQNTYNQKINDLLAITPQTETVTDDVRALLPQRDFYVAQLKEEVELNNALNGVKDTDGVIISPAYKKDLEQKLATYQANLKDPQKPIAAGITAAQYTDIMQTRINSINKTLPPPPVVAPKK